VTVNDGWHGNAPKTATRIPPAQRHHVRAADRSEPWRVLRAITDSRHLRSLKPSVVMAVAGAFCQEVYGPVLRSMLTELKLAASHVCAHRI
jgi:hypothetical protein